LGQTSDVAGVRDIFETNFADEITLHKAGERPHKGAK